MSLAGTNKYKNHKKIADMLLRSRISFAFHTCATSFRGDIVLTPMLRLG